MNVIRKDLSIQKYTQDKEIKMYTDLSTPKWREEKKHPTPQPNQIKCERKTI
jgi:hypothetical protein